MRRKVLVSVACALLAVGSAFAQFTLNTHSVANITGTGARALGMGGAFVALADDATAASWNPAGLAQLTRPEVSLVYDWSSGTNDARGTDDVTYANGSVANGVWSSPGHIRSNYVGFASATYPFPFARHLWVAQVSYNRMAKNPDYRFDFFNSTQYHTGGVVGSAPPPGSGLFNLPNGDSSQTWNAYLHDLFSGGYDSYALSLATSFGSQVRVGLSVDYIDASIGDNYAEAYNPSDPSTAANYRSVDNSSFSAWRGDVGVQWTPVEPLTFGAVYHSGFTATFTDSSWAEWTWAASTVYGSPLERSSVPTYRTKLHWPDGYQVGVAWHVTDRLIFAADYGSTHWSSARVDLAIAPGWNGRTPATFSATDVPYPSTITQHNTHTTRFGGEYTFYLGKRVFLPVRAGYFRDSQLAAMANVPTSEAPTFDGYSLGAGVTLGHLEFDVAWVRTKGDQSATESYTVSALAADGTTVVSGQERVFGKASLSVDRYLASMIVRF